MNLAIFGTSEITSKHIDVVRGNNINIIGITSLRKNSSNLKLISNKYYIKGFKEWVKLVEYSKKFKNCNFLITGRTRDNFKVLKKLKNFNSYKLIEKPLFLENKHFSEFKKDKKIFIGYNRIFYDNINYVKKKIINRKKINVIVKIPEENKSYILSNSCHIISVLFYLFGDLRVLYKVKSKNFTNVILKGKNNININISLNFGNSDNFSIEIFDKKIRYNLKPLEKLKIYSGMKKNISKGLNSYFPKLKYEISEKNLDKFKPGFDRQFKEFIKFSKGKKIINNIQFAHKIFKICKIISK